MMEDQRYSCKEVNGIRVFNCPIPYTNYWISMCGMYLYSDVSHRFMTYHINDNGYYQARISYINGKSQTIAIHRLIASTFHTKVHQEDVVLHIDGSKLNIHKDNLMYGSTQRNREQESAKTYNLEYNGEPVIIYNMSKFCRDNNLSISMIYSLLNGIRKTPYRGYTCNKHHFIDSNKGKPKLNTDIVSLLRHFKNKFHISYKDLSNIIFDGSTSFTTICNAVNGRTWKTTPLVLPLDDIETITLELLESGMVTNTVKVTGICQ